MSYVLAFLGFAALIILHEAGHFAVAKAVGMRVERFSLFFGPLLVRFRRGETEYGVGPIPLGGYVRITGMSPREEIAPDVLPRAYFNQPVWKRIVVILAGPAVNLLIAFVLLWGLFLSQGIAPGTQVLSGGLATPASSYLRSGDKIVAIDGVTRLTQSEITALIRRHHCPGTPVGGCHAQTPVSLTVLRDGKRLSFSIDPVYDKSLGATRIGVELGRPLGVGESAVQGLSEMWYVTHQTITTIGRLFEAKERKQLHSFVGIYKVTQQRFAFDAGQALYTLAIISLSLAVINLFPFLPLDGGHVFWAVAEKVRRRRIPFEVMERAGMVGFALILVVFVIGLSNDITTLTGTGFRTR